MATAPFAPLERVLDPIGKETAVGQAGQRVGQRRADQALVDRRVLEGDGDVVGKELDELEVLVVELVRGAVQVEGADDAFRAAHRGDDERLVLIIRRARHVDRARIVGRVVDALGIALVDHVAGDALAKPRPRGEHLVGVRIAREDG